MDAQKKAERDGEKRVEERRAYIYSGIYVSEIERAKERERIYREKGSLPLSLSSVKSREESLARTRSYVRPCICIHQRERGER